jgi:hypothetical protein
MFVQVGAERMTGIEPVYLTYSDLHFQVKVQVSGMFDRGW